MITRLSWRRPDSREVDPSTGVEGAAVQQLLATDDDNVSVLHLDAGGRLPREAPSGGRLLVVVAGAGTVEVGQETTQVQAGEAVRVPADTPFALATEEGLSVVLVEHAEHVHSWRVSRVDGQGRRWVSGVFDDTDRAREYRDRLREALPAGETAVMD